MMPHDAKRDQKMSIRDTITAEGRIFAVGNETAVSDSVRSKKFNHIN